MTTPAVVGNPTPRSRTTPTGGLHLVDKSWDAPGALDGWLEHASRQVAATRAGLRTAVIANELYRRPAVDLVRTASALCPAC